MSSPPAFALVVPTLNAGAGWADWLAALQSQDLAPSSTLVVDSASTDNTVAQARAAGLTVVGIRRQDFGHGKTRQWAVEQLDPAISRVVMMTHDAVLARPDALRTLLAAFDDPHVGAAFGRQLPAANATPLAAHARLFNYPAQSAQTSLSQGHGIKRAFLSNSFAAYRRSALEAVGGFPLAAQFSEDMYVGAKLILAGWTLAYQADATVWHSHNFSLREEWQRYRSIGLFHQQNPWIQAELGRAEGEGLRFVRSESAYLLRHAPHRLPEAWLRTAIKWHGYRTGLDR